MMEVTHESAKVCWNTVVGPPGHPVEYYRVFYKENPRFPFLGGLEFDYRSIE